MEEVPLRFEIDRLFCFIGEPYALTRNMWNVWTVYALHKTHYLPLGPVENIVSLSPSELADLVSIAKRTLDLGAAYQEPFLTTSDHATAYRFVPTPPSEPHITPGSTWEGFDTLIAQTKQQHPFARLAIPQSVLQQILQLPDDYSIKHIAIEDGALCVYCETPETVALHPKDVQGTPVMTADYLVKERNGAQWRRLVSVHVDVEKS